jgi:hypothetical protein
LGTVAKSSLQSFVAPVGASAYGFKWQTREMTEQDRW